MSPPEASSTFAAVPVKDLFGTKSRLAPLLDPGSRAGLTLYMMKRVISVLRRGGISEGNLCVVSPDRLVLQTAAEAGAVPLAQSSTGLNPALDEARQWAISGGASSLLVLPADLPLLTADDVEGLLATGEEASVAISSDATGTGTNALLFDAEEPAGLCVLAPWSGDGDDDHEAAGRAAEIVTAAYRVRLVRWLDRTWSWAGPESAEIPWRRARQVALSETVLARKMAAAAYGEPSGHDAVLPDGCAPGPREVFLV